MTASSKTDPPRQTDESSGGGRPLGRMVLISLLVAGAATTGVILWQDRDLQLIEDALEQGKIRDAHRMVTEHLIEKPGDSRAQAVLARIYVVNGQPAEAIQLFDQIGAATTPDLHALGRAYLMMQRWSEANMILNQVLGREPTNADALYEISSCRVRLGKFDDALTSANQLAKLAGHQTRGYLFIGTIQSDLGNDTKAAEAYANLLQHNPDATNLEIRSDELFLWYGRALSRARKSSEAIAPIKTSIELLPSAAAYLELGNAYLDLGDTAQAVEAWQDACDRDPISQDARQALANVAMQDGDAQQALRWLRPLSDNPNLRSATAYLIQRAHTMMGNKEEATKWQLRSGEIRNQEQVAETLASILIDDPNSYWAHIIRAHRFASTGNWEEARAIVEPLSSDSEVDPFVIELAKAIKQRSTLPPISRIPLKKF